MPNSVRRLYEFDDFRLDQAERLLMRDGTPVPLAPKAFEMLIVLVRNSGRLLTKDELMCAVWADAVVEENNLDKNISALRKALGDGSAERKLIETERGHGYRLNALVTEIAVGQHNGTSQGTANNEPASTDGPIILRPPRSGDAPTTVQTSPPPVEARDKAVPSRSWRRGGAFGLAALPVLAVAGTLTVHGARSFHSRCCIDPGITMNPVHIWWEKNKDYVAGN